VPSQWHVAPCDRKSAGPIEPEKIPSNDFELESIVIPQHDATKISCSSEWQFREFPSLPQIDHTVNIYPEYENPDAHFPDCSAGNSSYSTLEFDNNLDSTGFDWNEYNDLSFIDSHAYMGMESIMAGREAAGYIDRLSSPPEFANSFSQITDGPSFIEFQQLSNTSDIPVPENSAPHTRGRGRHLTLIRQKSLKFVNIMTSLLGWPETPNIESKHQLTEPSPNERLYIDYERWLVRMLTTLPDLYANNFLIKQASFFAAIYANARALGFDFDDYLDEESFSPISAQDIPDDDRETLKREHEKWSGMAGGLRPVEAQITRAHHPYLVCI
jgi:hypothetical protein